MNRRDFLQTMATRTVAATALGFAAGCGMQQAGVAPEANEAMAQDLPELTWDMPTSWPTALDTIFGGATTFAETVSALTGGRFTINARAAGEVAPGTEVLNVVEEGAFPIGHTASYYYVGKSPVTAFGTAVPFGLTAQQQNAWLYDGGGLELMQEIYARRFNVIQFPAGNTGVQMGGWFRKEINTVADLQGLKMRIPGLGGQVMARLGVTVQTLPGGEIFQALQTGAIDAAEWVGPYDDEKLGLNKAAQFYYYPGWWEPGPTLEVEVNLDQWNDLPEFYQEVIRASAYVANMTMLARYDARNNDALGRLLDSGVELRAYSDEILAAAEEASFALYNELAEQDEDFATVFEQWQAFRSRIYAWHNINEGSFARYYASKLS
ncbi:MAG TPA: ABC transporter substrate-binding protein [Caldilineaceae bacterium]|nr:ABC transporter substrate-binding protein [Caldilineaceae bacterium]